MISFNENSLAHNVVKLLAGPGDSQSFFINLSVVTLSLSWLSRHMRLASNVPQRISARVQLQDRTWMHLRYNPCLCFWVIDGQHRGFRQLLFRPCECFLLSGAPNPRSFGTQQFSQGLTQFSDMRCEPAELVHHSEETPELCHSCWLWHLCDSSCFVRILGYATCVNDMTKEGNTLLLDSHLLLFSVTLASLIFCQVLCNLSSCSSGVFPKITSSM